MCMDRQRKTKDWKQKWFPTMCLNRWRHAYAYPIQLECRATSNRPTNSPHLSERKNVKTTFQLQLECLDWLFLFNTLAAASQPVRYARACLPVHVCEICLYVCLISSLYLSEGYQYVDRSEMHGYCTSTRFVKACIVAESLCECVLLVCSLRFNSAVCAAYDCALCLCERCRWVSIERIQIRMHWMCTFCSYRVIHGRLCAIEFAIRLVCVV